MAYILCMYDFRTVPTFLKIKKRKRKNSDEGSDIDMKITPPGSPKEDDSIQVCVHQH